MTIYHPNDWATHETELDAREPVIERASPPTALRAIAALSVLTWLAAIAAVWGVCRLIGV
jgi:hypothetical protein